MANLSGANLSGALLVGANLSSASLSQARLLNADLRAANFTNANLHEARFAHEVWLENLPEQPCAEGVDRPGVRLEGTVFVDANLRGAQMPAVYWAGAQLSGADIRDVELSGACLERAILNLSDLSRTKMVGADLKEARLANAVLDSTVLTGADLTRASLAGAVLETTHLGCRERSDDQRCACALNFDSVEPSLDTVCDDDAAFDARCACRTRLSETNLAGTNLLGVDFTGADMKGANLLGATMGDSNRRPRMQPQDCALPEGCHWDTLELCPNVPPACLVSQTRFVDARLSNAQLTGLSASHIRFDFAKMTSVDLTGVRLVNSTWRGTNLNSANISDAMLTGTVFDSTTFDNTNLSGTRLDATRFLGSPSMDNTNLSNADLTNADVRSVDLLTAHVDGLKMDGSDTCIYRAGMVGKLKRFDPSCGPLDVLIPAQTFELPPSVCRPPGRLVTKADGSTQCLHTLDHSFRIIEPNSQVKHFSVRYPGCSLVAPPAFCCELASYWAEDLSVLKMSH